MFAWSRYVRCTFVLIVAASCFPAVSESTTGEVCAAGAAVTGSADQQTTTRANSLLQAKAHTVATAITLKDEGRIQARSERKTSFLWFIGAAIHATMTVSCTNLQPLQYELEVAQQAVDLAEEMKSDLEEEISVLDAELHSAESACTFATYWTAPTWVAGSGACLSDPELQLTADPAEDAAYDYDSSVVCLGDGESFDDDGTTVITIGSSPGADTLNSIKCVIHPGVFCAPYAGDKGFRVNPSQADTTFIIDHYNNNICARRTDKDKGWSMNLQIQCIQPKSPAESLQVTGCSDSAWNGYYRPYSTDHWQLDSSHEIYQWNGEWRIAQMGVSVYAHVIGAHGYSSPTMATFDHGCVVSEVPDLGTYMASDHAPFSREWGWDSGSPVNDKVNSVRLRCSATADDLWQTVVVTRPCQGDAEALISAKREEMVANTQELVELTNELKKLEEAMEHQQALIDANLCATVLASLKKVSDFLNNFLCQIMSGAMWVLSKGLDAAAAATPGLNAYILPLKAKPICFPESLYGWWGKKFAAVVKGGMTYAYAKLMCLLSEFEGARTWFENTDIIADTYSFGEQACHFNEAHGVIVSFIYNMACGNIAAAIINLAKPAIMCRLPWQPDGSMCQTHGCLFGPFGSSLVQGKAKIRKLITSGSLLRNRTSQ
mmetsp:Transcript_120956/g.258324  ORF Transcript_120956/g.258324 Transcript_120956/m.258324 type:complete len:660 (-) Transcript_120956:232-2211(-)